MSRIILSVLRQAAESMTRVARQILLERALDKDDQVA